MPIRKASHSPVRSSGFWLAGACITALLTACSSHKESSRYSQAHDSAPYQPVNVANVKDAVPRVEPKSRYGNPRSYVVRGKRYHTLSSSAGYRERGVASWYGTKFHGHRTSSGDTYDMYQMSAAHKSLPLPTYARVTNLKNGKSVVVKINDRGPFHDNRLIDLSYAAAAKLDILAKGTGLVEVQAIDPRTYVREQPKRRIMASQPKVARQHQPATARPPSLYLQVGAFLSRNNAERLQAQLRSVALPGELHISEGYSNEKQVYRVRIGPLDTVESADQLTQVLAARGIQSPRVVVD